jgi:hypothetical protein
MAPQSGFFRPMMPATKKTTRNRVSIELPFGGFKMRVDVAHHFLRRYKTASPTAPVMINDIGKELTKAARKNGPPKPVFRTAHSWNSRDVVTVAKPVATSTDLNFRLKTIAVTTPKTMNTTIGI